MSRILVSALVGAIIMFVFQTFLWMISGLHEQSFKYSEGQDEILEAMSKHLEDGYYYLPYFDVNTTTPEEQQAFHQGNVGKPWAMVQYHERMEMNMMKNMGMGLLIDLLICLIISLVLLNVPAEGLGTRMFFVLSLTALVMLGGPLMEANWFQTPSHYISGQLLDILLGYGLAGLWMAWWTGRK